MPYFNYKIFGLNFRSPLVLPGFTSINADNEDVNIQLGRTPNHLENVISSGALYESSGQEFLLNLPNVGKYYVKNGSQITIDPEPGASEDEIRLFLLSSVIGAILFQRGFLPLHGSAVEVNGKALMILGKSAAGKSTLASSLNKAGFPLISDDLSAISLKESGTCIIHKGIPFLKLWKDTHDILFPQTVHKKVRPQILKFVVPVSDEKKVPEEIVLSTIINLTAVNTDEFKVIKITGANKFSILKDHVYRDQLIKGMGILEKHFLILSKLANQIQLFHIERPSIPLNIKSLFEIVMNEVIKK